MLVSLILILWVSGFASAFIDNIPYTTTMIPIIMQLAEDPELNLPLLPLVWVFTYLLHKIFHPPSFLKSRRIERGGGEKREEEKREKWGKRGEKERKERGLKGIGGEEKNFPSLFHLFLFTLPTCLAFPLRSLPFTLTSFTCFILVLITFSCVFPFLFACFLPFAPLLPFTLYHRLYRLQRVWEEMER